MLFARNAQEAGDFALIARRAAEATETPFFNVQDGFLTTHTVENVRLPEPEFMKEFVGHPAQHVRNLMDPQIPLMSGVVQNQDSYMKGKIAQRWYYDRVLPAAQVAYATNSAIATGRRYDIVDGVPLEDAEYIIVGMGCFMETAEAAVDYLRNQGHQGRAAARLLLPAVPRGGHRARRCGTCKAFAVLERLDIPMMAIEPAAREIKAAFCDAMAETPGYPRITRMPRFTGGSAGLGSRDVRAGDFIAIVDNMRARAAAVLLRRHRPRAGARSRITTRTCATGLVLDARPLGRRLRLGDHQQGHRHHRRRRVRQGRAGLSEVRLGEEGPADDLLPDDRRAAHQHALRAGARRVRGAQRPQRVQSGESADGAVRDGMVFMQSHRSRPRRRSGKRCRPGRARR